MFTSKRRLFRTSTLVVFALVFTGTCTSSGAKEVPESGEFGSVRKLAATDAPNVLNVHVVPHTHDDVGWRKTVEQYYYGYNNTMERCGAVHAILTTSMQALTENPARTFTYVEMKFFSMWWFNQTDAMKDTVRFLIQNKQLTFVNGGWCMHDEATTHFIGMIDQTTLGHQFLLQELGVVPITAWQLDPFGHSSTQAKLLTYAAGMDAIYFGRIDYQDLIIRRNQSRCEGLWNPNTAYDHDDDNNQHDSTIFWGLTGSYGGNYNPPPGFCFDVLCDDEPLVGANTTRLYQRVMDFLQEIKVQSDQTLDNHIMLTFGEDFTFREAHVDFSNIDILIDSVMNYQLWNFLNISSLFGPRYDRLNIFYSNPDYYTQQKKKQINSTRKDAIKWAVKRDDFFPYSDCPHCFWTGYFTSRSALKRFERVASNFLLATRQIDAIASMSLPDTMPDSYTDIRDGTLYALEDAVSILQHHDAVAGTAKQHVADDYSQKLSHGIDIASRHAVGQLKQLMLIMDDEGSNLENLSYCPLLNETICDITLDASVSNNTIIYVFVYNPLTQNRSTYVTIPVASEAMFKVERIDGDKKSIIASVRKELRHTNIANEQYQLMFPTGSLPPLGIVVFRIVKQAPLYEPISRSTASSDIRSRRLRIGRREVLELQNSFMSATFDVSTGLLTGMSADGVVVPLNQTWGYYTAFDSALDSTNSEQNSGAYIFRPSIPDQKLIYLTPKRGAAKFVPTPVGFDVYSFFDEAWVWQITRIQNDSKFVEIEYHVGPIPIDDNRGKEIVTRYSTPIESKGQFFTDSNGREFQERKRNVRSTWDLDVFEPVAGNYYPLNAAIYVEDTSAALTVLVDRSQGGASLFDGSIEVMVQRRTLADDSRGVDEPLNETCGGISPYPPFGSSERIGDGVSIIGKHRIRVGKGLKGASIARSEMDYFFAEPIVFVASTSINKPAKFRNDSGQDSRMSLPKNAMVITFSKQSQLKNTFLIRIAHQYDIKEDESMSAPQLVDFSILFPYKNITSINELSLTGNQNSDLFKNRRFSWEQAESKPQRYAKSKSQYEIYLYPMEVRTFMVTLSDK